MKTRKFTLPDIPNHLLKKRFKEVQKAIADRLKCLHTIGGVNVYYDSVTNALVFTSVLNIDGDGGPHCYHPNDKKGLDYLANAGHPGNWWALYCVDGKPVLQKNTDPAPGFFISQTSLVDPAKKESDPTRYANSEKLPYISLSAALFHGDHAVKLGDVATVMTNGLSCAAIVADAGNNHLIGEGSIFLAEQLKQPSNPKGSRLPTNRKVHYVVYLSSALLLPNKKAGKLLTNSQIDAQATAVIEGRKINPASYFA